MGPETESCVQGRLLGMKCMILQQLAKWFLATQAAAGGIMYQCPQGKAQVFACGGDEIGRLFSTSAKRVCSVQGRLLGIKDSFLQRVAEAAIDLAGPCDANVPRSRSRILGELGREEDRFRTTLDSGEKVLEVRQNTSRMMDQQSAHLSIT